MIQIEPFLSISYYKDEEEYYQLADKEKRFDILINEKLLSLPFEEAFYELENKRISTINNKLFDILGNSNISEVFDFLNYQYCQYIERENSGLVFLSWLRELLIDVKQSDDYGLVNYVILSDEREKTISEWIETKRQELSHGYGKLVKSEAPTLKKIQWKGGPALFGYIFTELIKKGYIESELHNGEMSYQGTAKLFFNHFNVNNTTFENLKNEMNPGKCKLSDTKRAKFTIPYLSDLA